MPTFEITTPEGNVFHVTGDNAQGAHAALMKSLGQTPSAPQAQAPQQAPGNPDLPPMYDAAAKKMMSDNFNGGNALTNALTLGDIGEKAKAAMMGGFQGGIVDPLMGRGLHIGDRYNEDLAVHRDVANQFAQQHPVQSALGTTAGTVLSLPYLPAIGKGITGALKTGAAYGLATGAASDADGLGQRAFNTASGGVLGLGLGGLGGAAAEYAPSIGRAVAAPVMGYFNPEGMANSVLERAIQKSGQTVPDVQNAINQAAAEGNKGYVTADALGKNGQELLSTIARSPNDYQQTLAEKLINRQAGQSSRVGSFVKDALNANQTADQATAALTKARSAAADVNYPAARASAGPVDVTPAIQAADSYLQPGLNAFSSNATGIADNSIASAVAKAKSFLTDGKSNVSDFQAALNAKQEIQNIMDTGSSAQAKFIKPIRDALDQQLSAASSGYRNANDTFAQMSRPIEAVDMGMQAARPSNRAADTVPAYQALNPASQAAHNIGYADPLLARIEASRPGTNVVPQLQSEKYATELGAFAQDPALLNRQLTRENVMNTTAQRALGGSKTIDNALGEMQMSAISPSELANWVKHPIMGPIGSAIKGGANILQGRNATVRSLLGQQLMSDMPSAAIAKLNNQRTMSAARRAQLMQLLAPQIGIAGGRIGSMSSH